MTQSELANAPSARVPVWLAPLFLAGLVWFSHFFWSGKFGLYEDDYVLLEAPMNLWKLEHTARSTVTVWGTYSQGRPLHFTFAYWLGQLTTKSGGTFGTAYVAAFVIQVLNAWLVLLLARRTLGPRLAPIAAAVFALAPAHTTHQFLHACYCVQPSVAFMLLSLLAYHSGRRVLSYAPAVLTLWTYETCFMPLFLAPFLAAEAPKTRRVLTHWAVLTAILCAAFAVRSRLGEERVAEELSDHSRAVAKALRLATVGPATSAEAFAIKPARAFERLTESNYFVGDRLQPRDAGWAIFAATAFGILFLASGRGASELAPRRQLARVALVGAAMVVVSYPASLNRNPLELEGRMSSVHLTASTGWALLAGALTGLALSVLPRTGRRVLWVLVAVYLGALVAYHVTVQRDYVKSWAEQRRFWSEINRNCPDLDDETVILVPAPPKKFAAVEVNSHADVMLTQRMYFKLDPWPNPPMLLHVEGGIVPPDYAGYSWPGVRVEDGELMMRPWPARKVVLRPGKVIALYPDGDGRYHRLTGALDVRGVRLPLREPGGPTPGVIHLPLNFQVGTPPP